MNGFFSVSLVGLHLQHGTVVVAPYTGDGVLYQYGFLQVSQNRRYLVYDDDTPFLWMGDTASAGPLRARDEEWVVYLENRGTRRFSPPTKGDWVMFFGKVEE